ncbi:MAG: hypothetical protein MI923_30325 [Phycisphaerales bacterium]|nr:hypothetical protein [Phycisphaerales bacterium]
MPYRVRLTQAADDRIGKYSYDVQNLILDELERLATNPTSLSDPSHFPYPPDYQLFKFKVEFAGADYRLVACFKYAANENEIWIFELEDQIEDDRPA